MNPQEKAPAAQRGPEWLVVHARYEPYPLSMGSCQRICQMTEFLRRHYRVGLVIHQTGLQWREELERRYDRVWCLGQADAAGGGTRIRSWLHAVRGRLVAGRFNRLLAGYRGNPLADIDPGHARWCEELYLGLKPRAVIAEYVWSAVPALPVASRLGIFTLIDTHDVMTRRIASQRAAGLTPQYQIDERQEIQLLRAADAVIAIQREEAAVLAAMVPDRRVIVAEHPVISDQVELREPAGQVVLFVGSSAQHNVDGIAGFIRDQWPDVLASRPSARLRVIGSVCRHLGDIPDAGGTVELVGTVEHLEEEYPRADVVINPARFGSGLKIKAVEALAYGRALVSTPVGVEGLDGAGEVFVVTPFAGMGRAVAALLNDPAHCAGLQRAALAYARQRFAPERCFGELHDYLEKGRCDTL